MEQPDAGVCRTCLSLKNQLIEMQQAVPNLELMTYSDILDFCTNLHTPKGQRRRQLSTKYPSHICLRCSKALEVSYHFLKMVRSTDAILQGQQQDANELRGENAKKYETQKDDTPESLKVAVVIDKEVLLQEQTLSAEQKQQSKYIPTALVSGTQKDRTMEESQMLKPFTSNESPSKALWEDNGIKSDLCSIAELKDFDWMNGEYFGLGDNFTKAEDEKDTKIIKTETEDSFFTTISQDQYFTDSEAADCAVKTEYFTDSDAIDCAVKTEVFNPNEPTVNLPKIVLATQINVPYEYQLTEDFLLKNSITKAVENAKSIGVMMLNDFVDDLKENEIYDDNEINSVEEASYSSDDDKLLMKTMKHLVCGLCNETFTDMKEYSRHVNRHKGIIPVRCKHCNFCSCYPESMRKHYKKIHSVEPTNRMLNGPINPHKPAQERKYHHAITYQCSKCTKESLNRRDIRLHLLITHHVLNNTDALILTNHNCPECSRSFKHQRGMRLHFISSHGKRKEPPPAPGETFQCQTCAKVFRLKHTLCMHQRVCEGPTIIYCNLCNTNHDSVRQFEQHLRKEHAIEMIHECDICGKTFKNAKYLSVHRKRHTERNCQCELCPKNYIKKSELQVHIDRKHSTETKALCDTCGAAFTSPIDLRAHETREHFKKLHNCSHCSFKTTTISRLKLHEYTHVGMPYKCTICGKAFAFRVLMRHHSLSAHQITLNDIDLANMFRQNMGYPSRYDVFSNNDHPLDYPEVIEEDIQQELSMLGLNFDDIMRDPCNENKFNENYCFLA